MNTAKRQGNSLKESERKRREVYKPVLDNPYTSVEWPKVDPAVSKDIVDLLCVLIDPIGRYSRLMETKPEKSPEKPEISSKVTVGFNSTVKGLEAQAKKNIKKDSMIRYVFVCRQEIVPSLLTQHFPLLSYTASTDEGGVKLIQLPRGSMGALSEALNKPNSGIIGLMDGIDGINGLESFLDQIEKVRVEWLEGVVGFIEPKIKLLKTSAPIIKKNDQKGKKKK